MSELTTLARPYAEALFRMAQAENDLAGWSDRVQTLANIAADPQAANLIADPSVDSDRVAALMIDVAGTYDSARASARSGSESFRASLGERGANLVKLLAENGRLPVLPEIAAQFETLKASAEGVIEATITSAQALTQPQIDELVEGLKRKFSRAVNVQVAVDASLIGGAVIAVGDQVIDGSVKGRLQRMAFALQG